MFCPKCGLQNPDDGKFCRGCGADLSNVLAALEPKKQKRPKSSLAERSVTLYSRGVRGMLTSLAFLVITAIMFTAGEKLWFLIPLTFALIAFAAAISRFVQASGYKRLAREEPNDELPPARKQFLQPAKSFYETGDLAPLSVTERTTNLLKREDDGE